MHSHGVPRVVAADTSTRRDDRMIARLTFYLDYYALQEAVVNPARSASDALFDTGSVLKFKGFY